MGSHNLLIHSSNFIHKLVIASQLAFDRWGRLCELAKWELPVFRGKSGRESMTSMVWGHFGDLAEVCEQAQRSPAGELSQRARSWGSVVAPVININPNRDGRSGQGASQQWSSPDS